MSMIVVGYNTGNWNCNISKHCPEKKRKVVAKQFVKYSPVFQAEFRTDGRRSYIPRRRARLQFQDTYEYFEIGVSVDFDSDLVKFFQQGKVKALATNYWQGLLSFKKAGVELFIELAADKTYEECEPFRINHVELHNMFTEEGQQRFATILNKPYTVPER